MSQLTDFEQLRRQRSKRKLLKSLGILTLVALAILVAFSAMRSLSQVNLADELEDIADQFSDGEGYPLATHGGGVRRMGKIGGNVVLLTDNNFYRINPTGKVQMNITHNYFNPAMVVTSGRVLLYDRDSSGLRVDSRNKALWSKSFENSIITADMNEEGQLAVATGSSRYKGEVTVFNKEFKDIYYWYSAENRIISLALSERGNLMAVGTVETSSGMLRSVVNLFRLSSDKEVAKVVFDDELLLSLDYKSGDNTLYAITDKGVYAISGDGVIHRQYSFEGKLLWAFNNDSENSIVVALGDYKEQRSLECYRLGANLKPKGPAIINEHLQDIKCDGESTYVLTDNVLYSFDREMLLKDTYPVPDAKAMQPVRGEVYYATGGKVDKAVSDVATRSAPPSGNP